MQKFFFVVIKWKVDLVIEKYPPLSPNPPLTCLNPLYMTLISCLVKRVCLQSSSSFTGAAFSRGVSGKRQIIYALVKWSANFIICVHFLTTFVNMKRKLRVILYWQLQKLCSYYYLILFHNLFCGHHLTTEWSNSTVWKTVP